MLAEMARDDPEDVDQSEEDPVVRELDVYLNRDLDLWLLQFPLRPSYLDQSGFVDIKDAKVKPKNGLMELGVKYSDDDTKLTMNGTSVAESISLGIGKVRDECLHITPIKNIQQMRPSTSNFASGEEGHGKIMSNIDLGSGNYHLSGESDGENAGYMPVGRKSEAMTGSIRQNSYLNFRREQDKEPFTKLKTYPIGSAQSKEHFKPLYEGDD